MADPASLTVSIDRTSLSLAPLLLCGHDDPARLMSISDYQEPAMQPRILYAPQSDDVNGDMALGWSWQSSILGFNVFAEAASSEAAARAAVAQVVAAVARLSYEVTVTVGDADPETWSCLPGSVQPVAGRTFSDLVVHDNAWSVSIPCYPIRSA